MSTVKITIVGDISLAKIEDFHYGQEILALFEDSDLVIGNLEAVLTNSTKKRLYESYYLKANPSRVELLKPFHALSMSNNHVFDYRKKGLVDTIQLLERKGIRYFGVGLNRKKIKEPYTVDIKGVKIAVFGVTHYFNRKLFGSTGTDNMYSKNLLRRISKYKNAGFFVIVMPHWGYEHISYPSPRERKLARKYIKAGADTVIGSHPHEMQSYEMIDGKAVFYSLGNFIFSSKDFIRKDNIKLYESIVIQLKVNDIREYSFQPIPFITSDNMVELANQSASQKILSELEHISQDLQAKLSDYTSLFYEKMYLLNKWHKTSRSEKKDELKKVDKIIISIKRKFYRVFGRDWQTLKVLIYIYLKDRNT